MKTRSDLYVEPVQSVGSDEMIVAAARVSTGTEDREFSPELIGFLMKNRHGSPFEHGSMTFRVEAPIFVAREFMRHRIGWSYNEESGRYKVLDGEFYVPPPSRPLVQVGKPGAYEFEQADWPMVNKTRREMVTAYDVAWSAYNEMLEDGVAKEVARMVLPVGVYTSFYATANPRSIMHFLSLRTKDEHATFKSYPMEEINRVADQIEEHFAKAFPLTHSTWCVNGRVAP